MVQKKSDQSELTKEKREELVKKGDERRQSTISVSRDAFRISYLKDDLDEAFANTHEKPASEAEIMIGIRKMIKDPKSKELFSLMTKSNLEADDQEKLIEAVRYAALGTFLALEEKKHREQIALNERFQKQLYGHQVWTELTQSHPLSKLNSEDNRKNPVIESISTKELSEIQPIRISSELFKKLNHQAIPLNKIDLRNPGANPGKTWDKTVWLLAPDGQLMTLNIVFNHELEGGGAELTLNEVEVYVAKEERDSMKGNLSKAPTGSADGMLTITALKEAEKGVHKTRSGLVNVLRKLLKRITNRSASYSKIKEILLVN